MSQEFYSMDSFPTSYTTPLVTTAKYSIGPIIIAFIVLAIIIGVGLFVYYRNHHNEYDQGGGQILATIINNTELPQTVTLPNGKEIDLNPKSNAKIAIGQHRALKTKSFYYDGTPIEHTYKAFNKNATTLYITPNGFRTNLSMSENVSFHNQASFPVLFVQVGKGGRRWVSDIVGPDSSTTGHLVPQRSEWQVVHPTEEDKPLAEITVGGNARRLTFDGQKLVAYA